MPAFLLGSEETILPRDHFPAFRGYTCSLGIGQRIPSFRESTIPGKNIDQIRNAASNRLLAAFDYSCVRRVVEPYSLRRPRTGNLLLYVFEASKGGFRGGGIKAFKINEISNVEITQKVFQPKYVIQL